jgi:hypothetical protein
MTTENISVGKDWTLLLADASNIARISCATPSTIEFATVDGVVAPDVNGHVFLFPVHPKGAPLYPGYPLADPQTLEITGGSLYARIVSGSPESVTMVVNVGSTTPTETYHILLESGDALLLESGDHLLTEAA